MSGSSPPSSSSVSRELFRQVLGASPEAIANHRLIPAPPDMQIPGFTIPYTENQDMNASYLQSAVPQATYPATNMYHHQLPNSPHGMVAFTGGQYNQSGSGSFGGFGQQYEANKSSSPLYQDNSENVFGQSGSRPMGTQKYVANNSDSDNDSDDGDGQAQVFQGIVLNEDHYNDIQARRSRKASHNSHVNDIPESEEEQRALVKQLFESIINTDEVLDKPSKDGKPAQAVRRFRSGFYTSRDIELKCWEILFRCRDAARGVKLPGLDSKSKREDFDSFHTRYNKILDSCKMSKALCKQIMDPTYISRLVAAPSTEIQMKFNNKKINAERDIQNEIGRKAVKEGFDLDAINRLIRSDAATPSSPVDPALADTLNQNPSTAASPGALEPKLEIGDGLSSQPRLKGSMKPPNTPKTPKNLEVPKKLASTKRKFGSYKAPNSQNSFEDSGSGSDYEATPSKRQRPAAKARARTVQPTRRGSSRSQGGNNAAPSASPSTMIPSAMIPSAMSPPRAMNPSAGMTPSAPLMSGTAAMNLASASPAAQQHSSQNHDFFSEMDRALGQPVGTFSGLNGDEENSGLFADEASVALINDMERRDNLGAHYKALICRVLGITEVYADAFDLRVLRTYARAYNSEFGSLMWHLGGNFTAIGCILFRDETLLASHFAQEFRNYVAIGVARGDTDNTGHALVDGPNQNTFPTQTDPEIRRALGLVDNVFGIFLP